MLYKFLFLIFIHHKKYNCIHIIFTYEFLYHIIFFLTLLQLKFLILKLIKIIKS